MPVHGWTRVNAWTFHDFHSVWIAFLRTVLNQGILPPSFYAQAEQVAGDIGPDVLTLHSEEDNGKHGPSSRDPKELSGAVAVASMPPRVRYALKSEKEVYAEKQKHLTIRHSSNDRVVALIEILSPGNKDSAFHFRKFMDKAKEALFQGIHLLLIDRFPPTPRDPNGVHGEIWKFVGGDMKELPADNPLTLVSYDAGPIKEAYVEPIGLGDILIDMPLFCNPVGTFRSPWKRPIKPPGRGCLRNTGNSWKVTVCNWPKCYVLIKSCPRGQDDSEGAD